MGVEDLSLQHLCQQFLNPFCLVTLCTSRVSLPTVTENHTRYFLKVDLFFSSIIFIQLISSTLFYFIFLCISFFIIISHALPIIKILLYNHFSTLSFHFYLIFFLHLSSQHLLYFSHFIFAHVFFFFSFTHPIFRVYVQYFPLLYFLFTNNLLFFFQKNNKECLIKT